MASAPQQQMLGFFSVFVRWASNVKETKTGSCIRVRSVIGNQWATLQIPVSMAPKLQKGDYIEVVGSVTALPDQSGASNFLFVQEVIRHVPVDQVGNGTNCYPSDLSGLNRGQVAPTVPQQKVVEQQQTATPPLQESSPQPVQKKGGYRSNRRNKRSEQSGLVQSNSAMDVNVQAYANQTKPTQEPTNVSSRPTARKPRAAGYARNRRRSQTL